MNETASSNRERMRRYRERRRKGFRCIVVDVGESDLDGLIRLGHLDPAHRGDNGAIRDALHKWFDATIADAMTTE